MLIFSDILSASTYTRSAGVVTICHSQQGGPTKVNQFSPMNTFIQCGVSSDKGLFEYATILALSYIICHTLAKLGFMYLRAVFYQVIHQLINDT